MRARGITFALLCAALGAGVLLYMHFTALQQPLPEKECWSDKDCFVASILAVIKKDGLDAGYRTLAALYKAEPQFRPHCSIFGYALGAAIYKEYPDPAALALTPAVVACNYHLLQQYPQSLLLATGDTAAAQQFCAQVATQLGDAVPGAEMECYRGIGRGLPFVQKELWGDSEKMAAGAAEQCKKLSPNANDYQVCLSAVFNIIGRSEVNNEYGLSVRKGDPLLLCKEQTDTELRSRCFGNYKITAVSLVAGEDFAAAAQKLQQLYGAAASSSVSTAVWTLGYNWATEHLVAGEPFTAAIDSCRTLSPAFATACIEGMSVGLAKNGTPWRQDQMLQEFCLAAHTALPQMGAEHCPSTQALGYLRGFYTPAHFAAVCREYKKSLGVDCDTIPFAGYGY